MEQEEKQDANIEDTMSSVLMEFSETLDDIRACATGEKAKLLADGWSEEAAEDIGVTIYKVVLAQMVTTAVEHTSAD